MYRTRFEQLRAALEAQLGASTFEQAHAEGRNLALRQALTDAHAATDPFLDR
jgi:hypothetical protein